MRIHRIERAQVVRRSIDEVFAFFSHARNLEAITPPWLRFELLTPDPPVMRAGTLIGYRLRLHGVPVRWTSRIEQWEPGARFVDRQVRGPYRLWRHRHEFASHREGTLVRDRVDYTLPLGPLGELAGALFIHRDLERIFDYRRAAVARLFA
jgi:ligand-binding SRPBCC domain-containing protein